MKIPHSQLIMKLYEVRSVAVNRITNKPIRIFALQLSPLFFCLGTIAVLFKALVLVMLIIGHTDDREVEDQSR